MKTIFIQWYYTAKLDFCQVSPGKISKLRIDKFPFGGILLTVDSQQTQPFFYRSSAICTPSYTLFGTTDTRGVARLLVQF
jgi:hypothetical protein